MKKRWSFTKKGTNTGSQNTVSQSPTVTTSLKLYQGIDTLPLLRYIDALVDGNLSALIIEGQPTEQQLLEAWNTISVQYADAMGDAESKQLVIVFKEVIGLTAKISCIEESITLLRHFYVKEIAQELKKLVGGNLVFDVDKPDEYDANLDRAYRRSRGFVLSRDLANGRLDALKKKYDANTGKATRQYFQQIGVTICEYNEGYVPMDNLTTFEFCEWIKRINNRNQQTAAPAKRKK